MLTDYHTHLEKGDFSLSYLKQFIDFAEQRGIEELGISEHAYRFKQTESILMNDWVAARKVEDIEQYLKLFEQAHSEGIHVKVGIEMDYIPGKEHEMKHFMQQYPFDYCIGSIHWIDGWGIDLQEFKHMYIERDIYQVYQAYYDQVVTLAESKLFDIIGHLDLIKIFNYKPTDLAFLERQFDRAVKALAASDICIEISTAGLRKPIGEIYPEPLLLKKCFEAGISIVLSSDAHQPDHVGFEYNKSLALAREIGYNEIQVFSRRKREAYPLG